MPCPVAGVDGETCPVSGSTGQGQNPHQDKQEPPKPIDPSQLVPIPQPPPHLLGLLGNIPDVDSSFLIKSVWDLAELYGDIFKLDFLNRKAIVISSQELINEVCDESRFKKAIIGPLKELRAFVGDGLFTAFADEKNWWLAHRILVPVFGPLGIKKMFPEMMDIQSQLLLKWDRQGKDHVIDVSGDMTNLAFDTIGFCGFNYRFNDFYKDDVHPFAKQMAATLIASGKRANRTALENHLRIWSEQERQHNVELMMGLCDEILQDRKENPKPELNDVLNTMLNVKDPVTGEKLSDQSMKYNMATLLVAGHETTSATLSFTYYNLLKNPEVLFKAQQIVDEVVGDDPLELKHLPKLQYIDACIKETLRLSSPIANFGLSSVVGDTTIGGKYLVEKGTLIMNNLRFLHRDTRVWGDDVDVYRPERFLNGGFERLPPNSWKPFGNGLRACIGRVFAEQEMMMNLTLVLQRFNLEMADPAYELKLKSNLTIKPDGFTMKVRRRQGKSLMVGLSTNDSSLATIGAKKAEKKEEAVDKTDLKPLTVLYGTNSGTCQSFAEDLESKGPGFGFNVSIDTLNSATEHVPTDQPVVIITPSYEGKPPDNAKTFVAWLEKNTDQKDHLKDVKYALFGVGDGDWAMTFHKVPKLVDELLSKAGAERVIDTHHSDVKEDITGEFEEWSEGLWKTLRSNAGVQGEVEEQKLSVTIEKSSAAQTLAGKEISVGTVLDNHEIAGTEVGPAKLHMDVELPEDMTYEAGDYLVVLPSNESETVKRVSKCFKLHLDDVIKIEGSTKNFLPTEPQSINELLTKSVELNTPITQRQIAALAAATKDEDQKKKLESFGTDEAYKRLITKRFSILDVLEEFPSCGLDFGSYLDMLQPMKPRQYSISSSPLTIVNAHGKASHSVASITYDVFDAPALSGHGRFHGVSSNYLAKARPGDHINCYVRQTNTGFRLPKDNSTPIIMIAAGTGLAPMRGFIQERAAIAEAGVHKLGPAILYFGCRDKEKDFIYRDELMQWEKQGIVEIRPTFSQDPTSKHNYVHEHIWEDREEIADLFRDGGKIFICGSASKLARSTADTCQKIYKARMNSTDEEAAKWLEEQREDRYVSDVFG